MAVKNPQTISWNDPTQFEDGSPFEAPDFKAYELGSDPNSGSITPLLSLPVAFGVGSSPIPDEVRSTRGRQWIYLRTLDNYGQVSEWSNGVEVHFTGRPFPPSSVNCS